MNYHGIDLTKIEGFTSFQRREIRVAQSTTSWHAVRESARIASELAEKMLREKGASGRNSEAIRRG